MTTKLKPQEKHRMSEIDDNIAKIFDIKKRLGKGAYGIVWKALDKRSTETVAVKKIFDAFRDETDAQRTFREIAFLKSFRDHPNIVMLLSVFKAINNLDMYLVFEYMESDLHNIIKKGTVLKDIHKRYVMYQLINAIKYIHSGNVIHRDLKPSNILIDSKCRVKLADFGLARSVSQKPICDMDSDPVIDPLLTDYVATRWYRAPEILVASKRYTKGIDMWSLGCILGEMLRGKPLFQGSSTINQIEKIVTALPQITEHDVNAVGAGFGSVLLSKQISTERKTTIPDILYNCPADAVDLVESLLVLDPLARLTAKQAISHSYIQKFRNSIPEDELTEDVLPPLRDDVRLTVPEYRSELYEMTSSLSHRAAPKSQSTTKIGKAYRLLQESNLNINGSKPDVHRKPRGRPHAHKSEETLTTKDKHGHRVGKSHSDVQNAASNTKAAKKSVSSPTLKRKSTKVAKQLPPVEPKNRGAGEGKSQYFPSRGKIHSISSEILKEGGDVFIRDKRHSVDGGYGSLPEANKGSPMDKTNSRRGDGHTSSGQLKRSGSFYKLEPTMMASFPNIQKPTMPNAKNESKGELAERLNHNFGTSNQNRSKGGAPNLRKSKLDKTSKQRSPNPTTAEEDSPTFAKNSERICYELRLRKLEAEIEKYKSEVKSFCRQTNQYTQKHRAQRQCENISFDDVYRVNDSYNSTLSRNKRQSRSVKHPIQNTGGSGDHINHNVYKDSPRFPTIEMFGDTKYPQQTKYKPSSQKHQQQQSVKPMKHYH